MSYGDALPQPEPSQAPVARPGDLAVPPAAGASRNSDTSAGGRVLLVDARACMECQRAKCSCSLSETMRRRPAGSPGRTAPARCSRCQRLGLPCTPCAPRKRACAGCRAVKARCKWSDENSESCDRCARLGQPCIYFRVKQRKPKAKPIPGGNPEQTAAGTKPSGAPELPAQPAPATPPTTTGVAPSPQLPVQLPPALTSRCRILRQG